MSNRTHSMHRGRATLSLGAIACLLIASLVYFTWLRNPESVQDNGGLIPSRPNHKASSGGTSTDPMEPRLREAASAFMRLLESLKNRDGVDFGAIAKGFSESGFDGLKPDEMLRVLEIADFGDPQSEFVQGPAFLLETAAETLKRKCSETDVMWVARKLRQSSSNRDAWKWLKSLDLMSSESNQGAYVSLLERLPEGELDPNLKKEAEMLGRVLGEIGSERAVAALLAAAADPSAAMQVAVDSSIGYVQDQRAIRPIADLIDGPSAKTNSQLAAAVGMLGYIPSEYSAMSLRNLSADPNKEIAEMANESLKLLLSNNPGLRSVSNP